MNLLLLKIFSSSQFEWPNEKNSLLQELENYRSFSMHSFSPLAKSNLKWGQIVSGAESGRRVSAEGGRTETTMLSRRCSATVPRHSDLAQSKPGSAIMPWPQLGENLVLFRPRYNLGLRRAIVIPTPVIARSEERATKQSPEKRYCKLRDCFVPRISLHARTKLTAFVQKINSNLKRKGKSRNALSI